MSSFVPEVDRSRTTGTVEDIDTTSGAAHSLIVNPSTGEPYDLPPSVPTDEQGEIPMRTGLEYLQGKVDALETQNAELQQQVGEIPTEQGGGWQYTDWLEAPTLAVSTQDTAETEMGRLIFPPLTTQATVQFVFDVWSDDGGAGERGDLLVAPHVESLHFDIFPRDSDARFSVPSQAGKQYFNPAVVRAGSAGVFEFQGVPMSYPLTGAIGAAESNANVFDGKKVLVTLGARKESDTTRQWEVRNAKLRLAYQQ